MQEGGERAFNSRAKCIGNGKFVERSRGEMKIGTRLEWKSICEAGRAEAEEEGPGDAGDGLGTKVEFGRRGAAWRGGEREGNDDLEKMAFVEPQIEGNGAAREKERACVRAGRTTSCGGPLPG